MGEPETSNLGQLFILLLYALGNHYRKSKRIKLPDSTSIKKYETDAFLNHFPTEKLFNK